MTPRKWLRYVLSIALFILLCWLFGVIGTVGFWVVLAVKAVVEFWMIRGEKW